jgi:hypothetical protein
MLDSARPVAEEEFENKGRRMYSSVRFHPKRY